MVKFSDLSGEIIPQDDAVHIGPDGTPTVVYDQWYWNAVLIGDDKPGAPVAVPVEAGKE